MRLPGGGPGVGRPESRREREDRLKLAAIRARLTIAKLSDAGKIKILATAIVDAATRRGSVSMFDLRQAGVSEADAERLYDAAFEVARAFQPALNAMGTMP